MKRSNRVPWAALILPTCWLICAGAMRAQDQPVQETQPVAPKPKRLSFGIRLRDFPLRNYALISNRSTATTTYAPQPAPKDWNFTTTSHSAFWGAGLAGEFYGSEKWTVTAEVIYNRVAYTKQTNVFWGQDNPTTTTDERFHMFFTENTKGYLFDVPVLVHYHGLRSSGPWSRLYVGAGPTLRYAANIKSSLTTHDPYDNITTTNPTVSPSKRTLIGGTIAVGFRIVDDFNIKTTPEIRFTRWTGSTFSQDSTVSPRNQIEVGIGFTF